jgi:diamine N-acetyltransferase
LNAEPAFRAAAESDAGMLLVFMREYYAFDGHGFEEEKARVALVRLLRDGRLGRAWLIFDGAIPAGYVVICFGYSLEWLGRDAFIDELFLRAEYRGRGWGRKAIESVETAARALDVTTLHLEVVEENTTALEVYRRLGFKQHASTFMSKWIAAGAKPQGKHGH